MAKVMIQMITDYKLKLQKTLQDSLIKQKNLINVHIKEIKQKGVDVRVILDSVEEVELEVGKVMENEQAFLK